MKIEMEVTKGVEVVGVTVLFACREIRNVELLKLRFGESHMHYCEVMLKVKWHLQMIFTGQRQVVLF